MTIQDVFVNWLLADIGYSLPVLFPMFCAGLFFRIEEKNRTSPWKITVASSAVVVIIWFVAFYWSQHGSELPGTIAYFATGFPLGAFAGGIGLRIHQQVSDKKREKG